MIRRQTAIVGTGALTILVGVVILLFWPGAFGEGFVDFGVVVLGLVGAVAVLWMLISSDDEPTPDEPMAWADVGPLTESAPERTASEFPLASGGFTNDVERGCETARRARDPEVGLDRVRERLRVTLVETLVAGGTDRERAWTAIEEGAWTDDPVAAAVLAQTRRPPATLRLRLRSWLFPGREVRRRTRRAVAAIADTADEAVPSVVGQDAPRRIPVRPPTLAEQERTASGELQPAAPSSFGYQWAPNGDATRDTRTNGAESQRTGNNRDRDCSDGDRDDGQSDYSDGYRDGSDGHRDGSDGHRETQARQEGDR